MKKAAITILVIFALVVIWTIFANPNPVTPTEMNKLTYINASSTQIVVDLPFPGAVVGKNFSVIGKAVGPWYFEASFPVELQDKDGKKLASVAAQAQGEWMTANFVPFKADLSVPGNYIGPAMLILHKDNPSGLSENEASILMPITVEY